MNVRNLKNELNSLNSKITRILRDTGYAEYADLESVEYDGLNPDEAMLWSELCGIVGLLDNASRGLRYLDRPIKREGKLRKNSRGRYECNGYELTSGSPVEVLVYDNFYERDEWMATRVEHNGTDYYVVGKPSLNLSGVRARIRG